MLQKIVLIPILLLAPITGCFVFLWGAYNSPAGIQRIDIVIAIVMSVVLGVVAWIGVKIAESKLKGKK